MDTPEEQILPVKSAPRGPASEVKQEAADVTEETQNMPQTEATTQSTAPWTSERYSEWHATYEALKWERDSEARVVANYVADGNWDMAAFCAKKYMEFRQQIEHHMSALPKKGADKPPN